MKKSNTIVVAFLSLIVLFLIGCISLGVGARYVPLKEVVDALINSSSDSFNAIVVRERIPRTIFSILVGAALGVSGTVMQSITRNPIADPSILGINSGAAFFVVCAISVFNVTSSSAYIVFALLGGALTSVFVYGLGSFGYGGATPLKLALSGTAASTALTSLTNIIMLPDQRVMNSFRFWQVGSVSGASYDNIKVLLPFLIIGLLIAICLSPSLNILELGDEAATGLGISPKVIRILGAVSGVLLCASTTALAGPIGFVGLMVPHIIRLVIGNNLKVLVPLSAIGGAILLTASDIIGRIIGGTGEVEVGIITAILGGPIFVIVAMKARVKST